MASSYTTWQSLTDRSFTGRHLPEAEGDQNFPSIEKIVDQNPLPEKLAESEIRQIFEEQIDEIDYGAATEQKRVYVLDYAALDILQLNPGYIDGGQKQYVTTWPMA